MKRSIDLTSRGDCPGLDGGPVTTEHERRFIKQVPAPSADGKSSASMAADTQNAQNLAKDKAIQS